MLKIACSLFALFALTTCGGGGGSSPTAPKPISCDTAAFGGQWTWVQQSCGGFANGSSPAQLSTVNGCRLTLDVTPDNLKPLGQSYTLIVGFDTQQATIERKGTVCDAIDKGKIIGQSGRQFALQFQATPTEKCCKDDYFVNITY